MQYLLFICTDAEPPPSPWSEMEPATNWVEEMDRRGVRKLGNRLRPVEDATTVRVRGGKVLLTDGPFAETKEQIAGFDMIECRSTRRSPTRSARNGVESSRR